MGGDKHQEQPIARPSKTAASVAAPAAPTATDTMPVAITRAK